MSKVIITHIHARIQKLAERAIAAGLIEECSPIVGNPPNPAGYTIRKPGELVGTNYTPIAAGTLLLSLSSETSEV